MTFGFPAYHTERLHVPTDTPDQLHGAIKDTLQSIGWSIESYHAPRLVVKSSISLSSWGERIEIDFLGDQWVSITSKCAMPTQCFDWGRNRANVLRFFAELQRRIPSARLGG